jgi:aminomethyltransferase
MICAPDGGILDDLIVYRLAGDEFLVVANAANTRVVFRELEARAGPDGLGSRHAQVTDLTDDYALIALQGPSAARILAPITDADLTSVKYYASYPATVAGCRLLLARTGYTGEDGFELFARPQDARPLWEALTTAGAADGLIPAGLAARDTLRLEAGMPLYGNELGPEVTPYDAGLGRVVKLGKPGDFVGRTALAKRAEADPERELVGLGGQTRRIPRHGYRVLWDGVAGGTVTSGAPSPTLGRPIAMAYVEADVARQARQADEEGKPGRLAVDVRGSAEPAVLMPLPFYDRLGHRPA